MTRVFWTQRLHFGPSPRMGHALVYDAARKRAVLFGGLGTSGDLGDTWVWDGFFWTQVAETGPAARSGHAMAYDDTRQQTVLFGGKAGSTDLADTWLWDGRAWTQVAETGPEARSGHAMIYDGTNRVVLLFGGVGSRELGDTWAWDGRDWIQMDDGTPSARFGHSMAYNAGRGRIVLFGGASLAEGLDDTWEWDGGSWTEVAEFGAPGGPFAAMTYNGARVMLSGGADTPTSGEAGRKTTWEWDGRYWTEHQHFGIPGRLAHAVTFDTDRRRVVLFGGSSVSGTPAAPTLLGDTWELPASEIEIAPPGTLRIIAVLPNPVGDDTLAEEVHLRNYGPTPVPLINWKISNDEDERWPLDIADGTVPAGDVLVVVRGGRSMALADTGGTLLLINPAGETIDRKYYGEAPSGTLIEFDE